MLGIIFSIQNLLQYHFGQIWSYEVLTAQRRYIKRFSKGTATVNIYKIDKEWLAYP